MRPFAIQVYNSLFSYLIGDPLSFDQLFSANRWEAADSIEKTLLAGENIVCDRYAYSGVAFSSAKSTIESIDW